MTDQEKREIIERLACQCYVDHNDTYVWGTLDEAGKEPYLKQAEYWTKLLRYFELRELLSELAYSPITFVDVQRKYVEIQVPRDAVVEARDVLGGAAK